MGMYGMGRQASADGACMVKLCLLVRFALLGAGIALIVIRAFWFLGGQFFLVRELVQRTRPVLMRKGKASSRIFRLVREYSLPSMLRYGLPEAQQRWRRKPGRGIRLCGLMQVAYGF